MELNYSRKNKYIFSTSDLLKLFLPLVIEQLLEFLVGLTNSIMVASVGEAAVSGVSLVEFIMALLISLFAALSAGGSVIAGQYLGKRDEVNARAAVNQLVWCVGAVAIGIMILTYFLKSFILDTIFGQISDDVRTQADTYLTIVALSIPFLGLYGAGAAIFRTMGNSRLPMLISLLMGVMTVIGNIFALYVFEMGTLGVAISTLVSRSTATLLLISLALDPKLPLRITRTVKHRFQWSMIKRILGIGLPYGLENTLFYLGRIVVLGLVATFGTAAIAANAVAGTIVLFEVLPGIAIGLGMTVVIARCVGAGDYAQARYYTKKIMMSIFISHILINGLVLSALPWILDIYNLSKEATSLTTQIVWWHGAFSILIWPFAYTLPVTFRASGDVKYPMYVGILSMFFCRIAFAYLLGVYFEMGVFGTWVAMFIDWIVRAILFAWRYMNTKWTLYRAI
ncbi:MAG: MATE family efflux transporter [Negativicutes bacterium]|nr:MATE family efflux transporter [Negativicutes bacterium]